MHLIIIPDFHDQWSQSGDLDFGEKEQFVNRCKPIESLTRWLRGCIRGLTAPARIERRRAFLSALFPSSTDTFNGCVTRWHKTARHYVAVVRVRMTRRVSVSIHLAASYATLYETFPVTGDLREDLLIKMRE